jgi:hypothetical protein
MKNTRFSTVKRVLRLLQPSIAGEQAIALLPQQQLRNNAGGDGNQHIIAAGLHPVITARRRVQTMLAPVVDDILAAAVLGRQTIAAMVIMIGTGATLRATVISSVIVASTITLAITSVVALITALITTAIRRATAVVAILLRMNDW